MLLKHNILPWDYDRLPLKMRVWLEPIASTISAIENDS